MEIRSLVIAILIVAVTILQSGEAKICYVCDSRTSKTCASRPLSTEIRECFDLYCSICNFNLSNGTTITARHCGYIDLSKFQSVVSGNCNMCSEELCNTANTVSMSVAALGCLVSFWAIRFILKDSY